MATTIREILSTLSETYQVFLNFGATVEDFADLGSLDHLVQELSPVQSYYAHVDGVLDELEREPEVNSTGNKGWIIPSNKTTNLLHLI